MNMFQGDTAALAALDSGAQRARLLRLRFPDGDGPQRAIMLANRLDAWESLSLDFRYQVEVLSDDATVPLSAVMGKMVTVELVREDGSLRYFNGYVFEFRFVKTDGGFAIYDMVLGPWLAWLRLRQNNVAFHGLNIVELSGKVFENYLTRDWRSAIGGADPDVTYLCQHNESDHNFLHRHWENRGWFYTYEHRAGGHTLYLRDDSGITRPIDGRITSMPFQHHAGAMEDDGVHEWSASRRIGAGKTTLASFNFKNARVLRSDRASLNAQGAVPAFEVYENAGTYGFKDSDDGDALARRRMEERDARGQQFDARGNDRTAQPGRWFTLSGHFDKNFAGREYLILSVEHHASNNYQSGHGRGAVSEYRNNFSCIDRNVPWRPGRGFGSVRPVINGVQTARVVGPPDEEIYTDPYGRVKVQFHWDRLGTFDHASSPWIRVMSGWAGTGFGQISVPRIGMEVVIEFLDGDIDRPLIVGCLYNGDNMPPWELPANKTQSGILSRSTKGGKSANANALRFEDKRGQEEVWLHAEKDQRIEVEHDESHSVGNDRQKTVERDETVQVKRDRMETVGHDETISVVHNRSERVGSDETIVIGENRHETVGKNERVEIHGSRTERVMLTKEETILMAKSLFVGGAYQTTVGGLMNTTVALAQSEEVGLSKAVVVAQSSSLSAGVEHRVTVGSSVFVITANRIEIIADEILIRGRNKVEVHGDDIDHNPG